MKLADIGTEAGRDFSLRRYLLNIKTLISLILALLILFIIFSQVDPDEIMLTLGGTKLTLFLIAFTVYYLSIYLRGVRWTILLNNAGSPVRSADGTVILFLSWFVNVLVPAKIGDLYRAFLMRKNYQFSAMKSLGTIFAERLFDLITMTGILLVSSSFIFKGRVPDFVTYILLASFILLAVIVVLMYVMRKHDALLNRFLPSKLLSLYDNFVQGVRTSGRRLPLITTLSLGIWFLESLRLHFVATSLSLRLPLGLVFFIAISSSLLTTLPITPAGLGAVEFAMVGILLFFGVDTHLAASLAVLDRLISYWSIMPIGFLFYTFGSKG